MSRRHSRRVLLRRFGAAGVTGVAASVAGCSGFPTGDEETDDGESGGGDDEADGEDDGEDGGVVDRTDDEQDDGPNEGPSVDLGPPVEAIDFVVPTVEVNADRNELAHLTVETWEELGVAVNVVEVPFEEQVERTLISHDFDASLLGWGGTPERIDPHVFLTNLHHSGNDEAGGQNAPGFDDPAYDELVETQATQLDREERRETVQAAQAVLANEQPRTFVANEGGVHTYDAGHISNVGPSLGEGLSSFWNAVEAEPVDGDALRIGSTVALSSFNPLDPITVGNRRVVELLYDRLYRLDREGRPTPWAATGDPVMTDERTYIVELRSDTTFHDGEAVTVEDVKFSVELFADYSNSFLEPIDEIDVSGNELTFHLAEPFAPFRATALSSVAILPKHVWDGRSNPVVDADDESVGSGPFRLADWNHGDELRLEAYEAHFDPPAVDRLVRLSNADSSALFRDLEAGRLDAVDEVPRGSAIELVENANELETVPYHHTGFVSISYNTRREPLDDVHVRRALGRAVPKSRYVDEIRDGMGTVAHSPIAEHNAAWYNPDVERFDLDVDAARTELEKGGYEWDEEGKLHYPADR